MLTPFLLLAGVAITSAGQAQQLIQWVLENGYLGGAAVQSLRLSPILINAVAIGILYAVMPNRRAGLAPILISALVAGAAWHAGAVGLRQPAGRRGAATTPSTARWRSSR